ncbi:putative dsRNA binding motif-containing protein [Namao virus]|nr:putative dsRNA binding motif-containing protein [Namao virus]
MDKNAIQILNEYCAKNGFSAEYCEMYINKDNVQRFSTQVKVNEIVSMGHGRTKKESKLNAAIIALRSLPNNKKDISLDNPVSRLESIFIHNNLALPQYSYLETACYPTPMRFVVTCSTDSFELNGTGPTKKLAKKNAAEKTLEAVKCFYGDSQFNNVNYVGALQEFSMQHKYELPSYVYMIQPGGKISVQCSLNGITKICTGSNKKYIKQEAARAVYEEIHQ